MDSVHTSEPRDRSHCRKIYLRRPVEHGSKEMQPPVELSPGSWRRRYLQDLTSHKARDSVLTAHALRNLEHMDESRLSESATMKILLPRQSSQVRESALNVNGA